MSRRTSSLLVVCLHSFLVFQLFANVGCLKCIQCDDKSRTEPCLDKLPPSRDCQSAHASYCVTNKFYQTENDTFPYTIRGCSNENVGNKCEFGTAEGEPYKTCVATCWDNGCNESLKRQPSFSSLQLASFTLLLIGFLRSFSS